MVRPLLVTLGLITAFLLTATIIPADPLTEILSAGVFVASCFGLYRWGPAAWRNYSSGARNQTSWGLIGVVLLLFALAAQRVYSVLYLQLDRPASFQVLHVSPFITFLVLVALVLFIAATKFEGEHPNRVTGVVAAVLAFCGVMLSTGGPLLIAKAGAVWQILVRALLAFH